MSTDGKIRQCRDRQGKKVIQHHARYYYLLNASETDFQLHEDSPAIDNGLGIDAPSDDFDRNNQPQSAGNDIGAFEYVNDVVSEGTVATVDISLTSLLPTADFSASPTSGQDYTDYQNKTLS